MRTSILVVVLALAVLAMVVWKSTVQPATSTPRFDGNDSSLTSGVQLEYPHTDGRIPAVLQDPALISDASAKPPEVHRGSDVKEPSPSQHGKVVIVEQDDGTKVPVHLRPIVYKPDNGLPENSILENEFLTVLYDNGVVAEAGHYRNGSKQDLWTYWTEEGSRSLEGNYTNGQAEGRWLAWYDNGMPRAEASCVAGEFHGACVFWNEKGAVDEERTGWYISGIKVNKQ